MIGIRASKLMYKIGKAISFSFSASVRLLLEFARKAALRLDDDTAIRRARVCSGTREYFDLQRVPYPGMKSTFSGYCRMFNRF